MSNAGVGTATSYDMTVGLKLNVDDAVYMISPIDIPMLGGFGGDGRVLLSTHPVDQVEFTWMDEEIYTPRSTVSGTFVTADTVLVLPTNERAKFQTGDILQLFTTALDEQIRVTGFGTTADTLLVTRAWAGSTAGQAASGTAVIGVGTAIAEGSDPYAGKFKGRSMRTNNTQIFGPYKFSMTATEQIVSKYGVSNEWAHQVLNRTHEAAIARESAIYYGKKFNSTTSALRTMGGIKSFLTSHINAASTQLTVVSITTTLATCYLDGGVPDMLVVNPATTVDLNDTANTSVVRTTPVDTMRGRKSVMWVTTEYGDIQIVRDRWIRPQHAFLLSREGIIRRIMRPWTVERLAKTGDADSQMMVCEESLEVKGERHMAVMTGLVYTE